MADFIALQNELVEINERAEQIRLALDEQGWRDSLPGYRPRH